ncbi:CBS domain-containing protein [Fibrella sp. WM1]|uniref:CBS domain-containing protein n=1 Tax=Fibrella musci TaxID=3242485 RepID=UPI003521DDE0
MNIRQILQRKSINTIYSVAPGETVYEALQLMAAKNIGAVLVLDGGDLVGIFSERDYARKGILQGRASKDTLIRDVMTSNLITIAPEQLLESAMLTMSEKHIRHLPVLEGNRLIGIISINDVVNAIIHDQKARISSLESYISGSSY